MAVAGARDERQKDLFRPALDQIIDGAADRLGVPGEPVRIGLRAGGGAAAFADARLVAGLAILKHMDALSDEALCARWVENPDYQFFCGEHVFRHDARFDRFSLTRWRQPRGERVPACLGVSDREACGPAAAIRRAGPAARRFHRSTALSSSRPFLADAGSGRGNRAGMEETDRAPSSLCGLVTDAATGFQARRGRWREPTTVSSHYAPPRHTRRRAASRP
jgi:Transposase domain (DUF772)